MNTMEITLILMIWLFSAALFGYWAYRRGRSAITWFCLFILLGGIISIIILLLLPKKNVQKEEKKEPEIIDNSLWYYLDDDHNQYGPVSKRIINNLSKESYVWKEGMNEWQKLSELNE